MPSQNWREFLRAARFAKTALTAEGKPLVFNGEFGRFAWNFANLVVFGFALAVCERSCRWTIGGLFWKVFKRLSLLIDEGTGIFANDFWCFGGEF